MRFNSMVSLWALTCASLFSTAGHADTLTLRDETSYQGTFLSGTKDTIFFQHEDNYIDVRVSDVRKIDFSVDIPLSKKECTIEKAIVYGALNEQNTEFKKSKNISLTVIKIESEKTIPKKCLAVGHMLTGQYVKDAIVLERVYSVGDVLDVTENNKSLYKKIETVEKKKTPKESIDDMSPLRSYRLPIYEDNDDDKNREANIKLTLENMTLREH